MINLIVTMIIKPKIFIKVIVDFLSVNAYLTTKALKKGFSNSQNDGAAI